MATTPKKSTFHSFFPGLLPLFVLGHFGHHLLTALPIPLLPMIRSDFSLDYTRSGLVVSAFNLSYGIGQLPAGWLADRIGPRILMTIGICGVALAGFLVGLSQNFMMLIFFLALMGVLGGGYHPASPPVIFSLVEPKHQGRALGFHAIGGSASHFLAPLIAVAIATSWGWRGSFIGLALPTVVFGIMFYKMLGKQTAAKQARRRLTDRHDESFPTARYWRRLIPFMILTTFTAAVMFSTTSFIPLFLVDHFGFSKETAGAFFALIYSVGLWVGPLGGYLSDRLGRVPVVLTVCFLAGPIIYLLNWMPSWAIGILLLAIGIIVYVRMPVSEAFITGLAPEHNRSAILGIYYFSGMEGGGLLTPVMGYLIDQLGFYNSFAIAGGTLFLITLICAPFLWSRRA